MKIWWKLLRCILEAARMSIKNRSCSIKRIKMAKCQMSKIPKKIIIIKCYRCKQVGHYKNKCTQVQDTKIKNSNAFSAVFWSGNFRQYDWTLDFGTSMNITSNVNNIRNTVSETAWLCYVQVMLIFLRSHDFYCHSKGRVILCVPNIATNFISVSKLIQNGNRVDFQKNCRYMFRIGARRN